MLKLLNSIRISNSMNSYVRIRTLMGTVPKFKDQQTVQKGLILSESCVAKLKKQAGEGEMLRVTVDGGGCSGFQYKFDLDTVVNKDDVVFEKDGVKVVTDELSLSLLDGAVVDYHEELIRASFRIMDNPQAGQGCSCGASFAPKNW